MSKIITALGILSLGILFAFIVYIGYLIFWPVKTLVLAHPVATVLTPVVARGDALVYEVKYCRYDGYGAKVFRTLYGQGEVVYPLTEVNSITYPGCHTAEIYLMIPTSTKPGKYFLQTLIEIQVNLLKTYSIQFQTQEFTVK